MARYFICFKISALIFSPLKRLSTNAAIAINVLADEPLQHLDIDVLLSIFRREHIVLVTYDVYKS